MQLLLQLPTEHQQLDKLEKHVPTAHSTALHHWQQDSSALSNSGLTSLRSCWTSLPLHINCQDLAAVGCDNGAASGTSGSENCPEAVNSNPELEGQAEADESWLEHATDDDDNYDDEE